ncbi:restriction endonuclease [Streptomyces sp. NPDC055094]
MDVLDSETLYAALYLRTTSWEWPGERSDLHDGFSSIAAAFLAANEIASCALLDVPHPVISNAGAEIYARYISLEQPRGGYFKATESGSLELMAFIEGLYGLESFLHAAFPMHPAGDYESESSRNGEEAWGNQVRRALGEAADPQEDIYGIRSEPEWSYYRCAKEDISVFQGPEISAAFSALANATRKRSLPGVSGSLEIRGELHNFAPDEKVSRLTEIVGMLSGVKADSPPEVMSLENCVILGSHGFVVMAGAASGHRAFDSEKEQVLLRHQSEVEYLFRGSAFSWAPSVDGGRFQSLVHDLLQREPGVAEVRAIGNANEPDGGRDLIVDWYTPLQANGVTQENARRLTTKRRIIVQCKALSKSVGKSKIPDVRDMLEHYDAQGYLLAASGDVGTTAIDYLLGLRTRGDFFTDWWGRHEIEDRLRRNPDVANRYPDMVNRVTM